MRTRCWTCHAAIEWVRTESGAHIPLDPGTRTDGNVLITPDLFGDPVAVVVGPGRGDRVSHFASCPDADQHRKVTP